jgi:uncharacterized protein YkwD
MSSTNGKYKKYNLLLDPADKDEAALIKWLESKHGKKMMKNSYSAILKEAVRKMMENK